MKMNFQFEAADGGNVLWGEAEDGFKITAFVVVPEDVSDDYGYLAMKTAIMEELDMREIPIGQIHFPYDGQEQYLMVDASADTDVVIDISD